MKTSTKKKYLNFSSRSHLGHSRYSLLNQDTQIQVAGAAGEEWSMKTPMKDGGSFSKGIAQLQPVAGRKGKCGCCHWKRKQRNLRKQTCNFRYDIFLSISNRVVLIK